MKWVLKLSFVVSMAAFLVFLLISATAADLLQSYYAVTLKGCPLPKLTQLSLNYGTYWLWLPLVLCAGGLFIPIKDKAVVPMVYLLNCWLIGFVIVAVNLCGYVLPMVGVTYQMGSM